MSDFDAMTAVEDVPAQLTNGGELGDASGDLMHETVHAELRHRLIVGRIVPGIGLSTRGLAQELGVSQMPVREALGRLAAEGAVDIRSRRNVMVPPMTRDRFDDLLRCRLLLEPEAADRAFPCLDAARVARLREIDDALDRAMRGGDIQAYIESNFRFHFTIYRAHDFPILTRLIESLWLRFGPYMRVVYSRVGTVDLIDQHDRALAAIEAGDRTAFVRAIAADIEDGMGLIGREGLS